MALIDRKEKKRSHWIWDSDNMIAECEECHYRTFEPLLFCPMCGADKRAEEEEHE